MRVFAFCLVTMTFLWMFAASASGPREIKDECDFRDRSGATIKLRRPSEGRAVYFIFTADSMFEGGPYALDILNERGVKASFFLTGNFLRDSVRNGDVIRRIMRDGHYVGSHGDRHIQLADWDEARTTLVTPDSAISDMANGMAWLAKYGVDTLSNRFVVPPYEWYNASHIKAYRANGYIPVSPSPGLLTYRDYTTPDMPDYYSSETIWENFIENLKEKNLDGCFIILHLGTQNIRTDKFYHRLGAMIDSLQRRGYRPRRLE